MGEKKWEGCTRKGRKERTRKRRSTAREEEEEEEAGEQQIPIHGSKAAWLGSCQDFSAHFNYPVPYLLIYRRRMEVVLLRRSCRGKETVTKYAVLSRKRCIIDAELALPLTVCRPRGGNLSLRVSCHHTDEAIQEDGTTAEFIFTDVLCFYSHVTTEWVLCIAGQVVQTAI